MVAQGRHVDVEYIEAIVEIVAQLATGDGILGNLVGGGEDADIHSGLGFAAQPAELWSSRTRSSLAWVAIGISPTSSRSRVPLSASSKQPVRRSSAPVKAPFSWPKISLSIRVSGMAAQLMATNGLRLRGESW